MTGLQKRVAQAKDRSTTQRRAKKATPRLPSGSMTTLSCMPCSAAAGAWRLLRKRSRRSRLSPLGCPLRVRPRRDRRRWRECARSRNGRAWNLWDNLRLDRQDCFSQNPRAIIFLYPGAVTHMMTCDPWRWHPRAGQSQIGSNPSSYEPSRVALLFVFSARNNWSFDQVD